MTGDPYLVTFIICIGGAILAAVFGALGVSELHRGRRLAALPGRADGEVCGLLKSHLFRNEKFGDVPAGTEIGWGVAQGEQMWGGWLKIRIPPWFPCVRYAAGGETYVRLMGEGVGRGRWTVGQKVAVRYDPANPRVSVIEGDTSMRASGLRDLVAAAVFLAVAIVAGVLLATM